jgi:NTE family protein
MRMKKNLAFVLSAGGARGALQVGALRALFESGIRPDLLVGTSIGAINATALAIHGVNLAGVEALVADWRDAASADLLPSNAVRLMMSALFNRGRGPSTQRMREFLIAHGLLPDLRFGDIQGMRLILVATDLNTSRLVLYGTDPRQLVLEGVLASAALPPWVQPLEKDGQLLIDGGVISILPIEPAMAQGAKEIIALDLSDPRSMRADSRGLGPFVDKVLVAVTQREIQLELESAAARHVRVRRIGLYGDQPVAVWDFSHTDELIVRGYEVARRRIAEWRPERRVWWRKWSSLPGPRSFLQQRTTL